MSEKIYRVQLNSEGMPNFATAEEIPQGEWIHKNKAFLKAITAVGVGLGKAKLECFKCGFELPAVLEKENRNYCPNCGAKLIGIKGI